MSLQRILAGQLTEWDWARGDAIPADEQLTRVFVRDLVLDASIGVYAHEHQKRQRVRFNVELGVRLPPGGPRHDSLDEVMSYERVAEGIRALVEEGHINLVETMAERVAALALDDTRVAVARVRVEKLDVYQGASVGVEIERQSTPLPDPPSVDAQGERLLRILSDS